MNCNTRDNNMGAWGIIKKVLGPLKWLYLQIKPATLEFSQRDLKIIENHLEYVFTYRFKKGKWPLWVSKKDVSIPVGNDVEIVYLEILMPGGLESQQVKVTELNAHIHEILSPRLANIKNGEKLHITILKPIDTNECIKRDTLKSSPEQKEILFENLLPYPIEQHEISLAIPEPHPIKGIRIEKKGVDISANRLVKLETRSIETLTASELAEVFPDGVSSATASASDRADRSSHMKVCIDFEPHEKIKVILLY